MKRNGYFFVKKFVIISVVSCFIVSAFYKALVAKAMLLGGQSIGLVGPLASRAWLYEFPYSKEKITMYIVKGDVATVVNAVGVNWLQVDYLRSNGHLLRK
jgi:hypothetical protein